MRKTNHHGNWVDPRKRFFSKITKTTHCWVWNGFRFDGYGRMRLGKEILAHRVSWILKYGKIPKTKYILHKCENRSCVRISHLYIGTHLDNMRDRMLSKKFRGEKMWNAKLTWKKVEEIRRLYSSGEYSQRFLAKLFNISKTVIGNIVLFHNWVI